MRRLLMLSCFFLLWNIANPGVFAKSGPGINPALYKSLKWRYVGPSRGGRVTTVTGVPSQPNVYYMGASGGGIWKTENAGQTW